MPKVYQSLESEKYVLEVLNQDKKVARRRARKSAAQSFTNMIIVMLTIAAGYYIIQTSPDWLPVAETTFHELTKYKYA